MLELKMKFYDLIMIQRKRFAVNNMWTWQTAFFNYWFERSCACCSLKTIKPFHLSVKLQQILQL